MTGDHTLFAFAEAGYTRNPSGVVAATKRSDRWIETSTDDFQQQVRQAALGLYALGVRPGDRVVLHAENCTEWVVLDLATLSLGAALVPIYTTQSGDHIRYIVEDAAARVYIISSQELYNRLLPQMDEFPPLQFIGIQGAYAPGMLTYHDLRRQGAAREAEAPALFDTLRADVTPDTLATLIYTSGTTGLPKGVMLTHRNIVANLEGAMPTLQRVFAPERNQGRPMLSYLPLSHIFERASSFAYLHLGFPIYFVEDYNEILEDFKVVNPVHFTTVPRLLEKILGGIQAKAGQLRGFSRLLVQWALGLTARYAVDRRPSGWYGLQYRLATLLVLRKFKALFGTRIEAITSGGAALPAEVMRFFNAIGILCGQGYGLTETSPVLTAHDPDDLRLGSAGKAIPNVELKLGEDGEILARGPNVMPGYYQRPEATAEVLDPDGWFHTGDIGVLDADGFLYITDRKKALFKLSTGKYVAPQPIELALVAHPLIDQAVVVGNQHKFCAALIVPDFEALRQALGQPEASPDEVIAHAQSYHLISDIIASINPGLSAWEQIKAFRLLPRAMTVETGELTPTLKVRRRIVHEQHANLINAMYA